MLPLRFYAHCMCKSCFRQAVVARERTGDRVARGPRAQELDQHPQRARRFPGHKTGQGHTHVLALATHAGLAAVDPVDAPRKRAALSLLPDTSNQTKESVTEGKNRSVTQNCIEEQ